MQKTNKNFLIIKRLIKLLTAVILSYPLGSFFKSIYGHSWSTFFGALLGVVIGLFLIPYLSEAILLDLLSYRLWWMRVNKKRYFLLDSSAILDGRIVELVKTGLIDRPVFISSITLEELDRLNKTSDIYSRRVKRGLESIERLRFLNKNRIYILGFQKPPPSIREHILDLAKRMGGIILTLDTWITENARKKKLSVVNIHELSIAFRIQILPKEMFEVILSKPGKEAHQAVGYTEDGIMIIIEEGRPYIGKRILAECTSVLQSTSGKIIFGQYIRTLSNET